MSDLTTKIRQLKIEKPYLLEPGNYKSLREEVQKEIPEAKAGSIERIARNVARTRLKEEDRIDNMLPCISFSNKT